MLHSSLSNLLSSILALVVMLMLNHYVNWWLLPDILLLVLLQALLQEKVGSIWRFILPISFLMDIAAQTLLGFHGALYALMAILVTPLASIWSRASLLEQFVMVMVISVGAVVLRTLTLYVITDMPAPSGWYIPILTQIICWPLIGVIRASLSTKLLPRK